MRAQFQHDVWEAPALNKIPFIRWRWHYHFRHSMHDALPRRLNRAHSPGWVSTTGVLFHFKFVNTLIDKAQEEAVRGQHYAGGREYARYRETADPVFYTEGISTRYEGPDQLTRLGLMSPGNWF